MKKLPSDFKQISEFREHTGKVFLEKFKRFIEDMSCWGDKPLDVKDKDILMQMAQSVLETRGVGTRSWQMLQTYRQCLEECETPEHLDQITQIAVAFYAKFASYETFDDLPAHDNDKERRGVPSLWHKYGEENAIIFANMLGNFSNYMILESTLEDHLKNRLVKELIFSDARTFFGAGIHMKPHQVLKSDALKITKKAHALKTAGSSACICCAAAIAARADDDMVEKMKEFGKLTGYCAQIINDTSNEDIAHDKAHNAPNIVTAAGKFNLKNGMVFTSHMFSREMAKAKHIIASFPEPNKYLSDMLNHMEQHYRSKCQAMTFR